MITNYLKLAWRNVWRHKGFSITNLAGLAIGMTAALFILLWVQDELTWNHSQKGHENIYHVKVNRDFNGEITTDIATPFPLGAALPANIPGIEYAATDDYGGDHVLKFENTLLKQRGYTVSEDYFKVFPKDFIKGDAATALQRPENLVITASLAKALFGNDDPVGKAVKLDNHDMKTVVGVVKDPAENATLQYGFFTPFNTSDDFIKNAATDWVNCYTQTFVRVQPGVNIKDLDKKITTFAATRHPNMKFDYFLHGMDQWRLYADFKNGVNTGGMIDYVRLFIIIALVILVIACVNFMNLSTAKSEKRSKEVGIRKTLGSGRGQLLLQFYSESFIFSVLALVLSIGLVYALLPLFNEMIGKQLSFHPLQPLFLLSAAALILFTTLVAGSYPALYLSSFNAIKVLKGNFLPAGNAALPRKVLVVLQFGVSVLLITSSLLVYQQIQHVKHRNIGYNPNNLISIPSSDDANRNATVIKNELLASGYVQAVTRTSSPVTQIWNFSPAPDFAGKDPNTNVVMAAMRNDENFAKTVGTKIIEGRDLTGAPADSSGMLLNKAAVDILQLKEPIGKQMHYNGRNYQVIGVTDNMVMASPYASPMPMFVMMEKNRSNFFVLRLKDGVQPRAALEKIESIFKTYNPEFPFEYAFADQEFNKKFVTEDLIGNLSKIFAGLAIFLCCLGLSGLTVYTIERRYKEIGIRKVLGASVQQVLFLISKEFLLLTLIAALISIPITWWVLHSWLQNFEYRITLGVGMFVASALGVLLLTLLIVSLNAIRAARANPVKNLRTE